MTEEWKDVKGYEGYYKVSNLGNVKSLNYNKTGQEKTLSKNKDKDGYLVVGLSHNNGIKTKKIHRLVAEAFIPNPENKPCINHINTIKNDNRVENIEWVDYYENMANPLTVKKIKEKVCKPVLQKTNNKIIALFDSTLSVKHILDFDSSSISKCCLGKKNTHKGYQWQYVDDYLADWWDKEMEKGA